MVFVDRKQPDQIQVEIIMIFIRCQNCGNQKVITKQWLKEISPKLLVDNSNICKSNITKYSDRFRCSKCKEKKSEFIVIKKQRGEGTKRKRDSNSTKGQKKLNREAYQKASLENNSTGKQTQLGREAYLAALERKKYRDAQSGGIPEYEEGAPRSEFGTRKEHKSMRGWKLG